MTAPYQSKLIPHEDFIRQCRMKRWSYPRIAAALFDKHGIKVGSTTIFDFVKVRAQKRNTFELPAKKKPDFDSTSGFFEPAPTQEPHEIRKPKWNINPED